METSLKLALLNFLLLPKKSELPKILGGMQPPWPVRLCLCDQGHQDRKLRR